MQKLVSALRIFLCMHAWIVSMFTLSGCGRVQIMPLLCFEVLATHMLLVTID